MKLNARLTAIATVALLLLPNAAYAQNRNVNCDERGMENSEQCRDAKREKPRFQTKFFSE